LINVSLLGNVGFLWSALMIL